jgi:hypothetical protein
VDELQRRKLYDATWVTSCIVGGVEPTSTWIKFNRRQAKQTKDPVLTLQKGGMFALNPAAYTLAGEPQAIEFLYDPEGKRIALLPAEKGAVDSYPVRRSKGVNAVLVTGQAFTKFHEIDTEVARRYRPTVQDGMLVIELVEGVDVALRNDATDVSPSSGEASDSL